jgi:hypothetical protein
MLQWLYTYVSSVDSKCFIGFGRMLQVFHLDVAKVDLNVVYASVFFIRIFVMFALATHMVSSFF